MSTSEIIFLIVGIAGLSFLVLSLVLGEIMEIFHADTGDDLSWLSVKALAAAAVGVGSVGFAASYSYGLPEFWSWPLAAAGGVVAYLCAVRMVRWFFAQQYNSLIGRDSYVGCTGSVSLEISPENFGQVSFRNKQGALVQERATCADAYGVLYYGTRIIIVGINDNGVVVERDPLHTQEEM
jgi:hypothetical protein